MANTLTGLIPVIYKGLDIVARERIGIMPRITTDSDLSMAAIGQSVRSFVTASNAAVDITPGAYAPASGSQAISYNEIQITKSKSVPVQWTGEEVRAVGGQYEQMLSNQFAQAFRTLSNLVEVDLASAMTAGASRAYGTAGTTPFGTANDLSDSASLLQILDDNGTPSMQDLGYVGSNATMANFRSKNPVLFKVNEAGTADLLRQGIIGQLQGMNIGQSAALSTLHTKGTGATWAANGVQAVGATLLLVTGGTGTIVAGDVITFAGDTNKYVVAADLAAGVLAINAPGLRQATGAASALTVGNSYTPNLAFHKASTILLARQPIMPPGGDSALDVTTVTDPVSGLPFQVALYRQYRQLHIEVGMAWGVKVVKPDYIALNLG